MDTSLKIMIVADIFIFLIILRRLYSVSHYGKTIINANKRGFWAIFSVILWTGVCIAWCRLAYLHYTQNGDIFFVLLAILWIEISIFNIMRDLHRSEIRENGVYSAGTFYKWSKVQSYSWILPTTIQFEVDTFFKTNYSFEFTIEEELKSRVNETVQKYVL